MRSHSIFSRHPLICLRLTFLSGLVLGLYCYSATADDGTIPIQTSIVEMSPIFEEIPLTGSVMPRRESALSPEVDGLVSQIMVDEGDFVQQGDILVKLDNVIADLNAQQASAAREEAQESKSIQIYLYGFTLMVVRCSIRF